MARPIREKSGTGVYHVMLRGINRQDISEVVKRIGVTYAHYFNKKYERNGQMLHLPEPLAYGLGIACLVVAAVWFTIWYNKQERNQQ